MSNVETMCIMPRMDGLKIWRPDLTEAARAAERFNLGGRVDSLYLISSGEFSGFVVAGRPAWREAARDLEDPTLFDFGQQWPPGPEMKWGNVD